MKAFAAMLGFAMAACSPAAENGSARLQEFVSGSFARITQANAGRPMLVNFWSLNCPPCREEMPRLAALKRENPQLSIITVATDGISEREAVLATLRDVGLEDAENWLFADEFVERLRYEVDPSWYGELPRTFLYTNDGSRVPISGTLTEQVLQGWVAATKLK